MQNYFVNLKSINETEKQNPYNAMHVQRGVLVFFSEEVRRSKLVDQLRLSLPEGVKLNI